jgi:hypothetical protein
MKNPRIVTCLVPPAHHGNVGGQKKKEKASPSAAAAAADCPGTPRHAPLTPRRQPPGVNPPDIGPGPVGGATNVPPISCIRLASASGRPAHAAGTYHARMHATATPSAARRRCLWATTRWVWGRDACFFFISGLGGRGAQSKLISSSAHPPRRRAHTGGHMLYKRAGNVWLGARRPSGAAA